jgi:hypothetical protein
MIRCVRAIAAIVVLVGTMSAVAPSASASMRNEVYNPTFSWRKGGGPGVNGDGWDLYLPSHACASTFAESHEEGNCTFKYFYSKVKNHQVFEIIYSGIMCDAVFRATSLGPIEPNGFPYSASGTMRCTEAGTKGSGTWSAPSSF